LSPTFEAFQHAVIGLRLRLDVPHTLAEFNVDSARRELIGDMAIVDPTAGGNPIKLTKELALEIFDRAMEGRV
jgi:alcohol dehydrogenase